MSSTIIKKNDRNVLLKGGAPIGAGRGNAPHLLRVGAESGG